jgi:hypothetical protein
MSKRVNPASRVVTWFQTAHIESAKTILDICKAVVDHRAESETPEPSPKARASRRQTPVLADAPKAVNS